MCGIVGFINLSGNQSVKAETTFKELLFLGQIRGSDATGVALMTSKGKVDWIKAAGDPAYFYAIPDVDKYFQKANSSFAWIGHNRAGTVGKNTNDNAHPFLHENILGVHNGTIRNKFEITKNGHQFDVDSDAFFNGVQINGLKETVKKTEGALSVVYFDSDDHTINFARNDQRPMQFLTVTEKGTNATFPDKKFIFFGSELGLLWWVCTRNGLVCGEHIASTPLQHYKFRIGEEKPSVSPLEAHVPKWKGTVYNGGTQTTTRWPVPAARPPHVPAILDPIGTTGVILDSTVPFDLRKLPFMNSSTTSSQDKKTLERVFREAVKGKTINFKAKELIDLGSSFQVIGQLAGRKKADLPVLITTMVDKEWLSNHSDDKIFNATITLSRFTPDHKALEIIVRDPHEIFNNVKEAVLNAD